MGSTSSTKRRTGRTADRRPAAPKRYENAHLFLYRGRRFLLDVPTSLFFEVSPLAFDTLRRPKEQGRSTADASDTQRDGDHPDQVKVFHEIEQLTELGFLRSERPESDREIERYIRRLLRKTSTNITLHVSQACNLACKYCYADHGTFGEHPRLMTKELAKKAVDFLFAGTRGCRQVGIVFLGGEPLLNFDTIRHVVDYSQALGEKEEKRVAYSLTTNGTVLNDEIIEFLCRHRFGLKVSMDGDKELHDEMRPFKNGKGSYDLVAANLKKLLAQRGQLSVRPTLTRSNVSANRLAEFFEEFGFTRIGFGAASGTCFEKAAYDLTDADMDKLFAENEKTADVILERLADGRLVRYDPFENLLYSIHSRAKTRIRCGFARGVRTVSVDGRIYACHRLVGTESYAIGSLDDGIDQEKVYQLLWNYYQVKKHCWDTCWARHLCGGPCPQYVAHPSGRFEYPDKGHCEFTRRSFEFGIWFYDSLRKRFPDYLQSVVAR